MCPICEFVSYLYNPETKEELHLIDDQVWNSEQGKKLANHDLSKDSNGNLIESAANGHGAIKFFYEVTDATWEKCQRAQIQNFENPDVFPKQIVKDIKDMKMVRMSKGDVNNWKNLLPLLKEEIIYQIISEKAINEYHWEQYKKIGKEYPTTFNEKMLKEFSFVYGTSPAIIEELTNAIMDIFKNNKALCRQYHHVSNNITGFFEWHHTKQGWDYWINNYKYLNNFKLANIKQPESKTNLYWIDMIWKLFSKKKNRNPLWR